MSTEEPASDREFDIDYSDFTVPPDVNAFQRDILAVLSSLDKPTGVRLAEALETIYGTPIKDGRLYPSLDELDEMGLIDKGAWDKRSNKYEVTRRGSWVIEEYRRFIDAVVPLE